MDQSATKEENISSRENVQNEKPHFPISRDTPRRKKKSADHKNQSTPSNPWLN